MKMRITAASLARIFFLASWPIAIGVVFDIIDLLLGDPAQGWEWTEAAVTVLPAATIAPLCALLIADRIGSQGRVPYVPIGFSMGALAALLIMVWVLTNATHPAVFAVGLFASCGAIGGGALTGLGYARTYGRNRDDEP